MSLNVFSANLRLLLAGFSIYFIFCERNFCVQVEHEPFSNLELAAGKKLPGNRNQLHTGYAAENLQR